MSRKADRLGKALSQSSQRSEHYARTYRKLPLDDIRPNPNQPRKHFDEASLQNLAESIKRVGLLNPIVVVQRDNGYEIVAGDRRYRASKMAGLASISAMVLEPNHKALEVSLIENVQREDLHPLEEAHAYSELLQQGLTQDELGKRVGKSNVYISEVIGLLRLHDTIQAAWFLNREIVAKYKMKEISRLSEIEQLEAWKVLTDGVDVERPKPSTPVAKRGPALRPPPPKTVFSKVTQMASFFGRVDISRWQPKTRQKLRDELDAALERIQELREQLDAE